MYANEHCQIEISHLNECFLRKSDGAEMKLDENKLAIVISHLLSASTNYIRKALVVDKRMEFSWALYNGRVQAWRKLSVEASVLGSEYATTFYGET